MALLPALLLMALLPVQALAGRLDDVRRRGFLLAGVKDGVPPFGFRDPGTGEPSGFEPDLVRAVAGRLGVQARLEPVSTHERIPALVDGRLDLVAATLTHSLSRDEVIDFSVTYFQDGARLLVAEASGITDIQGPGSLKGRTVAVMPGDTAGPALKARTGCEVTTVTAYPQGFLALKQGRVDALAADAGVLLVLKNADPEPRRWSIVGPAMTSQPVAMGLPENESGLRDAVNKALVELWRDGEYRRIFQRWFGPDTPSGLPLDWAMETWPP